MRSSRLAAALFALSLTTRFLVYLRIPALTFEKPSDYWDALTHHLPEYLWFTSLKPPVSYLLHALVLHLFGAKATQEWDLFLVHAFLLDGAAVCLLFYSALLLRARKDAAFLLCLLYSLALIPFELWRSGMHYDHHAVFFTALFLYGCCRLFLDRSVRNAALASGAGALYIGQSTASAYMFPFAILAAVWGSGRSRFLVRGGLKPLAVVLFAPALTLSLLIAKNYAVSGVAATSNLAGQVGMMFVQKALDYDDRRIRALIEEVQPPDWYMWCHDHPAPYLLDDTKQPAPGWTRTAQAAGICFPWSKDLPGSEYWPHDFTPLRDKLRELGREDLVRWVEMDMATAKDRRYLFAGFSPEFSSRWMGIYGQVSLRVYKRFILRHPSTYLHYAYLIHKGQYSYDGPEFFRSVMRGKSQGGLRTLRDPIPGHHIFLLVARIYKHAAKLAYRLWPLALILCLIERIRPQILKKYLLLSDIGSRIFLRPLVLLGTPVLLLTAIFCMTVPGENDRYFVQITPYLTVIGAVVFSWGLRLYRRLR